MLSDWIIFLVVIVLLLIMLAGFVLLVGSFAFITFKVLQMFFRQKQNRSEKRAIISTLPGFLGGGGWENGMVAAAIIILIPVTGMLSMLGISFETIRIIFLVGFGMIFLSYGTEKIRQKRLVENIPTSTIHGAAMGLVELRGTVLAENTFVAPLTGKECVYHKSTVKGWRRRGNTWEHVTLYGKERGKEIRIDDGTGTATVPLEGVEIDFAADLKTTSRKHPTPTAKKELSWLAHTGRKKYVEYVIEPGDEIYVIGNAREPVDGDDTCVVGFGYENLFHISDRSERLVARRRLTIALGAYALSLACFALSAYLL